MTNIKWVTFYFSYYYFIIIYILIFMFAHNNNKSLLFILMSYTHTMHIYIMHTFKYKIMFYYNIFFLTQSKV